MSHLYMCTVFTNSVKILFEIRGTCNATCVVYFYKKSSFWILALFVLYEIFFQRKHLFEKNCVFFLWNQVYFGYSRRLVWTFLLHVYVVGFWFMVQHKQLYWWHSSCGKTPWGKYCFSYKSMLCYIFQSVVMNSQFYGGFYSIICLFKFPYSLYVL